MATPVSKTELLKTSEHELVKQYQLIDAQSRPYKIYTAPTNAVTGDPCLITEIIYIAVDSNLVLAQKEGYSTWDSSFIPDSSFTVSAPIQSNKSEKLMYIESELTKEYQELDGQGRPLRIYTAPVFAATGTPCLVAEYIYQSPTSSIFLGKKEGYSNWNSTWVPDSSFTVSY